MPLTKLTTDVQNVQALNDRPNANSGMTADQVKATFDKAGEDIKDYNNNTLTVEIDAALASISAGTGLADGSVITVKLADGSVTTIKLADLSVTAAKVVLGTLTLAQMSTASLDSRYYTETEINTMVALLETKADLTTNRKLSATGDFTGTLDGNPIVSTDPGLTSTVVALQASVLQRSVNVKSSPYNAVGNGIADDTVAIQAALNYLESIGGGVLFFPAGTYIISIAHSSNVNSCLVIPDNITFQGAGMGVTFFTRPTSERATDGLLFVNKGWDTATGYSASGNIKFLDFTISDGAATPNRASGDLIALGHSHDILIERVESLNHDQHFVDMAGCHFITIRDCVSTNSVNSPSCPIYQIDQAIAGAIRGINPDGTSTTDVNIVNNTVKLSLADNIIQIHNGCVAQNILIEGNHIAGDYLVGSKNIFVKDPTASMVNCKIINNFFSANDGGVRMININCNEDVLIKDLEIAGNSFSGKARIGVYVGVATVTSAFPEFREISIHDNTFELDWRTALSSGSAQAIKTAFCKNAKIYDNEINYYVAGSTATAVYPIWVQDNKYAEVYNNTIRALDTNANASLPYIGIYVDMTTIITKSLFGTHKVRNNQVIGDGFYYGISQYCNTTAPATYTTGVISGNFVYDSAPYHAHYYESVSGSCDGTNNVAFVNFGAAGVVGNTNVLLLASSQLTQNIPMPYKKSRPTQTAPNGNNNPCTFKIEKFYSPNNINNFANDIEDMQTAYLSSTTFVGTEIVDVTVDETTSPATNKFSILTGVSGVSVVINISTFQPVLRTTGYLMIRIGI